MGQLKLLWLFGVFMTSAVLGDAVNYAIGNKLGAWLLALRSTFCACLRCLDCSSVWILFSTTQHTAAAQHRLA
jgi:membrane protein DedA with SNARE-associated domain